MSKTAYFIWSVIYGLGAVVCAELAVNTNNIWYWLGVPVLIISFGRVVLGFMKSK